MVVNLGSIPFAVHLLLRLYQISCCTLLHYSPRMSAILQQICKKRPLCLYSICLIQTFHTEINVCLLRDSSQQNIYSYSNFSKNPEERSPHLSIFLDSCFILLYCLSMCLSTAIQKSLQLRLSKFSDNGCNGNGNRNGFIISSSAVWEWLLLHMTESPEICYIILRIK